MFPTPFPTRARRAGAAIFFINGAVIASWLPHIPDLKARLGISDGGLGLVLLGMAGGAVIALPVAGWLVERLGSRALTSVSAMGLCAAVALPVLTPNVALTVAALGLLGAWNATLDVAMNAQAVLVEGRYERPIMSSFHALWSLGGLAGAGAAAIAMAAGMSARAHIALVALLSLAGACMAARDLLPSDRPRNHAGQIFALPPPFLLGLGLLTFCALLAEGAVGDWSAVYLRDSLGAAPATAATGFAAFSLAMALGRLGGGRLARRLGPVRLLRLSGTVAGGGLAMSLLVGHTAAALLGFGLVGLGIANLIPILFSAAGRSQGVPPGTALAAVATTGYLGYLAGPPLIGLAAEAASLPAALAIVCVACGLVGIGARVIPTTPGTAASPSADERESITPNAEITHA